MTTPQNTESNISHSPDTQQAVIKPVKGVSKVWLLPILALLVGGWMVYKQWQDQGPLIEIQFTNVEGVEAGKTKIKTRDLEIGIVKKVELSDDLSSVIVTARLNSDTQQLLHKDNQFWIVSPRVSLNGISGLSTLLSGPFINMELGSAKKQANKFVALDSPPTTKAGTPGLKLVLRSKSQFSYAKGDSVIYKGIKVGEFEDISFNFDEREILYDTFIQAPYHELITNNTKFWDISGVSIELNSEGIDFTSGSLESMLTNGVTFGIPDDLPRGTPVQENSQFTIHTTYEEATEGRYAQSAEYVIFVQETVRGLKVGAPVEYRGLVIGNVLSINTVETNQIGLLAAGYDIPVLIGIQPGRVQQPDTPAGVDFVRKQIDIWIKQGLRARLESGNLITGSLFVDLQHYPDAAEIPASHQVAYPVIPTISGEFSQITAKISTILDNINRVDLQALSNNTNQVLIQIASMVGDLRATNTNLEQVLASVNQNELSSKLANTLDSISVLTQAYSGDSQTHNELQNTLVILQQTMKSLQPILQQVNSKPNSLIFSEQQPAKYVPKAASSNDK